MEKSAILQADILDIVFEGRNKEYGAYDLRRTYNKRMRVSISVMLLMVALLSIGQLIASRYKPSDERLVVLPPDVTLEKIEIPEEVPPPIPPPQPPPPEQIRTIQHTVPLIVDEEVPEEDKPPLVDDLENAKIDVATQDGTDDIGIVAPPEDDKGKGIVVAPKVAEEDLNKPFMKVEKESEYPGGLQKWYRFVQKNLIIPQAAIDNIISGTVIVKFVVDKEGNVSDVVAISGPEELRDAAIRVIKKSGKWTPALQNGRHVPSYKHQPIVIKIDEQ